MDSELTKLTEQLSRDFIRTSPADHSDLAVYYMQLAYELCLRKQMARRDTSSANDDEMPTQPSA
jgi:hypothetical protein